MRHKEHEMHALEKAFRALQQSVSAHFRWQFLLACCIIASGLFWMAMLSLDEDTPVIMYVLAIAVIFSGSYAFAGLYRMMRVQVPDVLYLLKHEPGSVVWIYRAELQVMPFGVDLLHRGRMHICLRNGEVLNLRASNKVIDMFTSVYSRVYPHFSKGYSVENQQLFDIDPYLLVK